MYIKYVEEGMYGHGYCDQFCSKGRWMVGWSRAAVIGNSWIFVGIKAYIFPSLHPPSVPMEISVASRSWPRKIVWSSGSVTDLNSDVRGTIRVGAICDLHSNSLWADMIRGVSGVPLGLIVFCNCSNVAERVRDLP
jgi:hypothetical protein